MRLIAVLLIGLLAACSAQPSPPLHQFKPEQIVRLADDAWGCDSYTQLGVAADHYNKGEYSAWSSELDPPLCFLGAKDSGDWTVYETREAAVRVGKASVAQYSAAKDSNPSYDPRREYWVPVKYVIAK